MKVSVITPVYNAERFVRESVESALRQSETGEVLLIEDGSTDASRGVCEALAKEHDAVRLFFHEDSGNHGQSASRNVGLREARFDFVAYLDADDRYLAGRFDAARDILERHADVDGVYEAVAVEFESDADREAWFRHNSGSMHTLTERLEPGALLEALVTDRCGRIHLDGLAFRKRIVPVVGMFNERLSISGEDTEMCVRMAAVAKLMPGRLDDAVAVRRRHAGSVMTSERWQRARRGEHFRLWQQLFRWGAARRRLSERQLDLLADTYLFQGDRGRGDGRALSRLLARGQAICDVAARHPSSMRQSYFWRHAKRAFLGGPSGPYLV